MMLLFKFIFVILLCIPIGYLSLKLLADLGNGLKEAKKVENLDRKRRIKSGEVLTAEERRAARRSKMGRKVQR